MEVFDAIITRRSIRKYSDKPVDPELVLKILKAAMYAPSANNFQSWQFIVITERKILNEIPKIQPYSTMLNTAQTAILICGDQLSEKLPGYNAVNCSAATQNLLLAAHGCGLGTCWIGIYPREERCSELKNYYPCQIRLFLFPLFQLVMLMKLRKLPKDSSHQKFILIAGEDILVLTCTWEKNQITL